MLNVVKAATIRHFKLGEREKRRKSLFLLQNKAISTWMERKLCGSGRKGYFQIVILKGMKDVSRTSTSCLSF